MKMTINNKIIARLYQLRVEFALNKKGTFETERIVNQAFVDIKKIIREDVILKEDEIKDIGMDLVEEVFPKGECKERGKAIVLYALLIIRFMETIRKMKEKLE